MSSQIRGIGGYRHVVADPAEDLVMAAWAHVDLRRLVRLDAPDFDDPEPTVPQSHRYPSNAHASRPMMASTATATNA